MPARAERLTLKVYTTGDGLPNNLIQRVVVDSRGFLWFCTGDGLSRFDGYTFTNYSLDQGLPSAIVSDVLETRAGVYWIGTESGLVRLNPFGTPAPRASPAQASSPATSPVQVSSSSARNPSLGETPTAMFTTYVPSRVGRARYVESLFEDRDGGLWVGTLQGLYRATAHADGRVDFSFVDVGGVGAEAAPQIARMIEDRRGMLWIGATSGLYRRSIDGRIEAVAASTIKAGVTTVLEARDGTIWVGTRDYGIVEIGVDPASGRPTRVRARGMAQGLPTNWINEIVQTSDGTLWAGGNRGLIQIVPATGGGDWQPRVYSTSQGVRGEVWAIAEDGDRNLWLGLPHTGVVRLRYRHISSFDGADGLTWAVHPFETRAGEIVAIGGRDPSHTSFNRFDGKTFDALGWLRGHPTQSWAWHQAIVQDRVGDWWIATNDGVFRFSGRWRIDDLPRVAPTAVYTTRDGLSSNWVLCLFEDSRGDVWIATAGPPHGLSRWSRRTGTFTHYQHTLLAPPHERFFISSIAEDRAGNLWLGFSGVGGLARLEGDRVTRFVASAGAPAGLISNLILDATGRLWAATDRAGICRIDQPTAAKPTFVPYTTAHGLSSNAAQAIGEDRAGLIYVGTGRGIDRLDPATGRFTHYSSADGVPAGAQSIVRDRHGALWFGSAVGLTRLVPDADPPAIAPPIRITGVRLGARRLPISALGERDVQPIAMPAGSNQLQVDFVALGSTLGEGVRYQYRLEGAADEWSQPSDQRTVNFASLAPGAYRLSVRAVNADRLASPVPATLAFTVPPPTWQRWWFLTLVAAALAAAIYAVHRARVVRLLEVANLRARIATDLHDDVGANLTRIAILSEVARQQSAAEGNGHGRLDARLAGIARIARESVDGMSDIVWAVSPNRDSLADLVRRMREHVEETFAVRNLAVVFHPPDSTLALKLGATVRRDVFLIFKEAVNNAARHARASSVTVNFHVDRTHLRLAVADDGVGFDPAAESDGLGQTSMRRRAERLGASLDVESRGGAGTTVTLTMALDRGAIPRAARGWTPSARMGPYRDR